MKKKSKFLAFCLSLCPGLGQLYLGLNQRAILFFVLFFGPILGASALAMLANSEQILAMLLFILPLVWFVSLADALNMTDRLRRMVEDPEGPDDIDKLNNIKYIEKENRKIITLALSLIPGAGHMYMGRLKQGAFLMAMFFASLTLTGWLKVPLVGFVIPVIWFYSVFEAYHIIERNGAFIKPDSFDISSWLLKRPKWIGWGLIIVGVMIITVKIAGPVVMQFLSQAAVNNIETGFVALVLIAGGIKLVLGTRNHADETSKEEALS